MMRGRGWGNGGGPRRRWGRRMRLIEPMLLLLLAQEEGHGYALLDRLQREFGVEGMPAQTVYRLLQEMEAAGWVVSDWDLETRQGPPRRTYRLTPAGREMLDAWAVEMGALDRMVGRFLEAYQRLD